jgi:geranylgeranyl reductase family protein
VGGDRFDVAVVGAGPAGSAAALVLARAGARVALIDKAAFPRDKACGDLVGPRGVRVLDDLGLPVPGAVPVGDMLVTGPTHSVRLPSRAGRTYPGHGVVVPRRDFDSMLRDAAVAAGAEPRVGRAEAPVVGDHGVEGCTLTSGPTVRADVVIGADGALSGVARWAGLVQPERVLWGFATRAYVDQAVALPEICWWEPTPWRAFPGYGWLFPGPGDTANVGLGCGVLADRGAAAAVARGLPGFLEDLVRRGLLARAPATDGSASLGGWLKLGMVGTLPAVGRVLLVGDAAGLVNPLQGEGIAQALESGRAAAEAVLAGPAGAADRYRGFLAARYAPYHAATAPVHAALLPRPRAVALLARTLTAPGLGRLLAGGWALYWNELLDGATPGAARAVAVAADRGFRAGAAGGAIHRWFRSTLGSGSRRGGPEPAPPQLSLASSGKSAKRRSLPR